MEDNITTIPQEMQDISPDEAAASLAFATQLQQQMMMPQQEEGLDPSQEPQEAPEQAKPSIRDKYPKKEESTDLGQIKEDIEQIKTEISQLLKEDDNEEGKTPEPTEEA